MREETRDRGRWPGLLDRLTELIPARLRPGAAIVPVVRLSGLIGAVTPLRPGMSLGGVARTLERAFAIKHAKAVAVVIYSQTGATARIFSKHRFPVPIIALSSDHAALRRMALHYGVLPCELAPSDDLVELVARVDRLVQELKHAEAGERVIIVAGVPLGTPGATNMLRIAFVGSEAAGEM